MTAAISHINTSAATLRPASGAWLPVSAAFATHAHTFADRDDLVVIAGPKASAASGAPACFWPAAASIEIDTDACMPGIDPATIDPNNPRDLPRYPAAIGALAHEAAHAAHSRWDPQADWPGHITEAAMLLEEIRIEAAQLRRRPGDRDWLRACVAAIIAPNLTVTDPKALDAWDAGIVAALLLGRVDAGVLDGPETSAMRKVVSRALTKPVLARLRRIWIAAIAASDTDHARMRTLAERWCTILHNDPRSGTGRTPRKAADRRRAIDAARAAAADIAAQAKHDIAAKAQAGTSGSQQASSTGGNSGPSPTGAAAARPGADSAGTTVFGRHHTIPTRPATSAEQAAARRLARALTHAPVTQRDATSIDSATPPGKLKFGQVLTSRAQAAAGRPVTATPWRKTTRKRPPQPRPTVGIALDVSPSMRVFIDPASAAAWICAHATVHAHGTCAAATFGTSAKALIPPGPPPPRVPQPPLEQSTNRLDVAIGALDAVLGLATPGIDARLLILVTDGGLAGSQTKPVAALLDHLAATGCALVQITPGTGHIQLSHTTLVACDNATQAIHEITKAVTSALAAAAHHTT